MVHAYVCLMLRLIPGPTSVSSLECVCALQLGSRPSTARSRGSTTPRIKELAEPTSGRKSQGNLSKATGSKGRKLAVFARLEDAKECTFKCVYADNQIGILSVDMWLGFCGEIVATMPLVHEPFSDQAILCCCAWWCGRPRIHRWSGGEQKDEDGDEDGNAPKKEKLGMAFMDRQFSTEAARRKALERARREAEYGLRVDKKRCPVGFENNREGVGGGGRIEKGVERPLGAGRSASSLVASSAVAADPLPLPVCCFNVLRAVA